MVDFYKKLRMDYFNLLRKLWCAIPFEDPIKQKAKSYFFNIFSFFLKGTETYRRWKEFSARAGFNEIDRRQSLCKEQAKSQLPCEIITTKHTFYVACLIRKSLAEMGRSAKISFDYSLRKDKGQMFFVICPQMFRKLPKKFIAFQMEQSTNLRWFTPEYLSLLHRACAVWDYSLTNIEYLVDNGIPFEKLFYMPIGVFYDYDAVHKNSRLLIDDAKPEIDVLFYGDPNCERRQKFLKKIGKRFNLHVASEVFGEELYLLLKKTKIVVNIHYYENALLETTRICETLSMGIPIISEKSQDLMEYREFENIVEFTEIGDIDQMITKVTHLLKCDSLREERKCAIKNFVKRDRMFLRQFSRYLLAIDALSLDTYLETEDFFPRISCDIPKLCLSLSETPIRTHAFIKQAMPDFQIVEGLRHVIGWVGCGMSYKYIAHSLIRQRKELAVICEDDVLFPPDFNLRLNRIIAYLQHSAFDWHLFSGMIAHLHPETKVLKIEEFDGIEYIHIDTMTSMVMNVYSAAGLDLLARWNEKNTDPYTNTIDRYLEKIPGLVAIVTLPFLVSHNESQASTLWGIENAQYRELIDRSERLLADKVVEYKNKMFPDPG